MNRVDCYVRCSSDVAGFSSHFAAELTAKIADISAKFGPVRRPLIPQKLHADEMTATSNVLTNSSRIPLLRRTTRPLDHRIDLFAQNPAEIGDDLTNSRSN